MTDTHRFGFLIEIQYNTIKTDSQRLNLDLHNFTIKKMSSRCFLSPQLVYIFFFIFFQGGGAESWAISGNHLQICFLRKMAKGGKGQVIWKNSSFDRVFLFEVFPDRSKPNIDGEPDGLDRPQSALNCLGLHRSVQCTRNWSLLDQIGPDWPQLTRLQMTLIDLMLS